MLIHVFMNTKKKAKQFATYFTKSDDIIWKFKTS